MAIHQSVRTSDLEKRLKILRSQVYGKQTDFTLIPPASPESQTSSTLNSDLKYLNKDLGKILTLAGLALGIELGLFLVQQNHLLSFLV